MKKIGVTKIKSLGEMFKHKLHEIIKVIESDCLFNIFKFKLILHKNLILFFYFKKPLFINNHSLELNKHHHKQH